MLTASSDGSVLDSVVIAENKAFFTGQVKEPALYDKK